MLQWQEVVYGGGTAVSVNEEGRERKEVVREH